MNALVEEVRAERMTSNEALAILFEVASTFNTSNKEMLSDIGSVLSRSTVGSPLPSSGSVPVFDSTGFRAEYRDIDNGNQVRHVVAFMIVGATVGVQSGELANTGREAYHYATGNLGANWADVRVGNAAAAAGWLISVGAVPRHEIGNAVRRWFGE